MFHVPSGPAFRLVVFTFALGLLATFGAQAADDPSIGEPLRGDIQSAMKAYVEEQTIGGAYRLYDPVDGRLLRLSNPKVHAGIVKKGDFYVSCADFTDQDGRSIDVDFLVVDAEGTLKVTQGIVHKIDGIKRPYHLESP